MAKSEEHMLWYYLMEIYDIKHITKFIFEFLGVEEISGEWPYLTCNTHLYVTR